MLKQFLQRLKMFFRIMAVVKNWPEVLFYKLGLKKNLQVKFRNRFVLKVDRSNWTTFMSYVNFLRDYPSGRVEGGLTHVKFNGKDWQFDCGRWGPSAVSEVFCADVYGKFLKDADIKGKDVVDIGAWIGDTPVYFAARGARKVYCFEPAPYECQLALKNIKLNKMEDVCLIENAAVGKVSGELTIDPEWAHMFGSNIKEKFKKGVKIPMITLENIVRKLGLKGAVLKSDCEGYEYDIFLNTPDDILRKFDIILVEFHYGPEKLVRKLESAGFKVEYTKPHWHFDSERKMGYVDMSVGFILARKIS